MDVFIMKFFKCLNLSSWIHIENYTKIYLGLLSMLLLSLLWYLICLNESFPNSSAKKNVE